jgi:hypothetical protein
VTLGWKKTSTLIYFIHYNFWTKKLVIVILRYSCAYCGWNSIFFAPIIPSISIFAHFFWPFQVELAILSFYPHRYVHSFPSGCPAIAAHNLAFARHSLSSVSFDTYKIRLYHHLNLFTFLSFVSVFSIADCHWWIVLKRWRDLVFEVLEKTFQNTYVFSSLC